MSAEVNSVFVVASADREILDRWRESLGEQATLVEVRRVEALPECLMRLQPQLLLLDLRLQRAGTLRDIAEVLKMCPGTRIIAFATEKIGRRGQTNAP